MNTANGVLLLCLLLSHHCSTQASGRIPGWKRDPSRLNRMPAAYGKREIRLEPAFLATLRSENMPLQGKRVGVLDRMPMSFGKRHDVINVKRSKYPWDENSPQMVSDSELIRQIFAIRVLNGVIKNALNGYVCPSRAEGLRLHGELKKFIPIF